MNPAPLSAPHTRQLWIPGLIRVCALLVAPALMGQTQIQHAGTMSRRLPLFTVSGMVDGGNNNINYGINILSLGSGTWTFGTCYSLNSPATINSTTANMQTYSHTGPQSFLCISGLQDNTYYYVRAFAKKNSDVIYSQEFKIFIAVGQ